MEKAGSYCFLVKLEFSKNNRNAQRMNDIRFTRFSALILMLAFRNIVCLFDHAQIVGRMIFKHKFNKLPI